MGFRHRSARGQPCGAHGSTDAENVRDHPSLQSLSRLAGSVSNAISRRGMRANRDPTGSALRLRRTTHVAILQAPVQSLRPKILNPPSHRPLLCHPCRMRPHVATLTLHTLPPSMPHLTHSVSHKMKVTCVNLRQKISFIVCTFQFTIAERLTSQ